MIHEAWLVDLDGTLYRSLPMKLAMGVQIAFADPGLRHAVMAFRAAHENIRAQSPEDSTSPYEAQLDLAAERVGLPADRLAAIVEDWMIERPSKWIASFKRRGLIREIANHRAAGGRTALVSDYPARRKLAALDLATQFEVVVANGEDGGPRRLKPDPEGYLIAAKRLGVPPAACLVIGDRDDADGEAARRAGMAFRRV